MKQFIFENVSNTPLESTNYNVDHKCSTLKVLAAKYLLRNFKPIVKHKIYHLCKLFEIIIFWNKYRQISAHCKI